MKPKGLLTEKEYLSIVDALLSHSINWGDYLNACEVDYLPINQNFYPLLLKAINKKLLPDYKILNDLQIHNPGKGIGKHNFRRLQNLEGLREFVKARTEKEKTFELMESEGKPAYNKPSTRVWALFYWYKWQVGLHPELDASGQKKKSLEELARKHGISYQNLLQTFNAVGRNREKNPKRNPTNIELVIPKLADFPEAQQMAIKELEEQKKKK